MSKFIPVEQSKNTAPTPSKVRTLIVNDHVHRKVSNFNAAAKRIRNKLKLKAEQDLAKGVISSKEYNTLIKNLPTHVSKV